MSSTLSPNRDLLTITMPVNVAESARECIRSMLDACGNDEADLLCTALAALDAALDAVPFLTITATVGDPEPAFFGPDYAYGGDGNPAQDDTPSLANCDDWGTGEGRFHGRI